MEENNKHPKNVVGFSGSLQELAHATGSMRYKEFAIFIAELSADIKKQANDDLVIRNRKKLSQKLFEAAQFLDGAEKAINDAWEICKPYMKEDDK